jgi:hypothetical protein
MRMSTFYLILGYCMLIPATGYWFIDAPDIENVVDLWGD